MRPSLLPHTTLTAAAIALAACATPHAMPKPSPSQATVYVEPVFIPDCLMPPPEMLVGAEHASASLELNVSAEGRVLGVRVLRSAGGAPSVDAALVSAATACRFRPAAQDGVPVAASVRLDPVWRKAGPALGLARCFTPPYPRAALRQEKQGTTEVDFLLAPGASAPTVRLARSSGDPRLDRLTLDWVSLCMARPEARAGLPLQKWLRAPVEWALE